MKRARFLLTLLSTCLICGCEQKPDSREINAFISNVTNFWPNARIVYGVYSHGAAVVNDGTNYFFEYSASSDGHVNILAKCAIGPVGNVIINHWVTNTISGKTLLEDSITNNLK